MSTENQNQAPAPGPAAPLPAGAPAPAPAADPTPGDIKAPAPPPAEKIAPTGDPGLDLALEFFSKAGLSPKHEAIKQARETGDFTLVRALLAEKGTAAEGFDRYVDIAQASSARVAATEKADREAAARIIYEAAGGEENWKAVRAWAGEQATPQETTAINAALKGGGLVARVLAEALAQKYAAAKAATTSKSDALPLDASRSGGTPQGAPLGPREFQRELANLTARVGTHGLARHPEYATLVARRAAFKG